MALARGCRAAPVNAFAVSSTSFKQWRTVGHVVQLARWHGRRGDATDYGDVTPIVRSTRSASPGRRALRPAGLTRSSMRSASASSTRARSGPSSEERGRPCARLHARAAPSYPRNPRLSAPAPRCPSDNERRAWPGVARVQRSRSTPDAAARRSRPTSPFNTDAAVGRPGAGLLGLVRRVSRC